MDNKSDEVNIHNNNLGNNYNEKKLFLNNSNITGITFQKNLLKENNKIYNLKSLNALSPKLKNNRIKSSLYKSLSKKEKLKYIHNIIKQSIILNEPYDFYAIKRKKYTLSYLIHQFDSPEKSQTIKEKNICKSPYPLLYCISNRRVGNDSSNLLEKILSSDNKQISKKQEKEIKNSFYTKIFNSNLSDLLKNKIKNKNNIKTVSKNLNNNFPNISKFAYGKKSPFLNQYIKIKFNNYKYKLLNKNEIDKYSRASGFFSEKRGKKFNKKMKKWNSAFSLNINGNNEENSLNNNIEHFKNKTVCLHNHKNNLLNYSIINERNKKRMDEIIFRKRRNNSEKIFDEIIKDASHLKFNNQLMGFDVKIKDL